MCGIVGIAGPGIESRHGDGQGAAQAVRRMAETITHRGPDGEGFYDDGGCAIGIQRLAIVDLEASPPPFASEDGSIRSVVNGEIYNGDELRKDLQGRGHRFTTRVDTEVIPHLYEERGADLVHALHGMFALAVWDKRRRTLLLARDRAGEKPLFYFERDGEIAFASELRALVGLPGAPRGVDPVALRRYLLHGFFPAPLTPFAGIEKLPAGHLLTAGPEGVAVRSYWDLADHFESSQSASRQRSDIAEELDERLARAVERRRKSDVPVGVFLSGGLDSSTVLAYMAEQVGVGVPVFALGHTDAGFDEAGFARETAQFFDADFHQLVLSEADLADGLRRVGEGFDEPLGDASTIPSHLLARFARDRVKVVLSGEGADELFAGYPTYLGHRVAGWYGKLPAAVGRALLGAAAKMLPVKMGNVGPDYLLQMFASAAQRSLIERHSIWFGCLAPERHGELFSDRLNELLADDDPFASARSQLDGREFPDDLARLLYTDFTMYLQDDLLTKVDRATMLASLEARAPFLDHELAEFVAGLPSGIKLSGLTTKAILRRAVRRRLPKSVLSRRKRGFNIPFSRWLLHGLGEQLRERFSPEKVESRGLFSPAGVNRLLDEHLSLEADHRKPLFALLVFDLWCDRFFGDGNTVPLGGDAVPPR